MINMFPFKNLHHFSKKNKPLTYGVFLICLMFAALKGYLNNNRSDPYALMNFFDHWTGLTKKVFDTIITFLYTPIGTIIWLSFVFMLFLWLLFILTGLRQQIKFSEFLFPFLSLCYLGIVISIISFVLIFVSIRIPYIIRMIIFLCWLMYYLFVLIKLYRIKPVRSAISVLLSFAIVFLLGGFPAIAPYLQWI